MIYDDQPQMMDAAQEAVERGSSSRNAADNALFHAFAAIDRDALIDKAVGEKARMHPGGALTSQEEAESILVAAGIIPEREL